jgi:peroxiredoxin
MRDRKTATFCMLAAWLVVACAALTLGTATNSPSATSPPAEGDRAPLFGLTTPSGAHWSLARARGHVVVVNFFATWCPPCRSETPDLVALERRYAPRGVIFIGVDDEEKASLVTVFAKDKGVRFPLALDTDGAVARSYDVRAIPTTYVVDPVGVIRYRQVDELNGRLLASVLDDVLAGMPVPESAAAQKFQSVATTATAQVNASLQAAKSSSPPNAAALDLAIQTALAANKTIDGMLSKPDASSISYFNITATRGTLNSVLADAYSLRASLPGSKTATADRVEAGLLRGQILIDQERFTEAAAQFDDAMKLAPKDVRGYDGAYMAAYELKDYPKAAQVAADEATLAPDEPESWLTLGSSQNSLKNYPAALEAERKALTLAAQAYTKNPTSKDAAYELGRVWLKMGRTQLLAGNAAAARPLLLQAQAAAPSTIVEQQANEQFVALEPSQVTIDKTDASARAENSAPAKVYVIVRNPSSQERRVNLVASGLPPKWVLSFCYSTVCNPYRVSFGLPAGGSKRIELLVAPLAETHGPWSMQVNASGASTALLHVEAKTAKAAITITAS